MKRSPPGYRPKPTPPGRLTDGPIGVQQLKRELVRTSFDSVFPGMPPALKLSA